jgi:CheY-like chemotaxis protein
MPEMSGFDFLRDLATIENLRADQLKIFILSSSLDPTDLKKVEQNKLVSKFIGKPLTQEILEEI